LQEFNEKFFKWRMNFIKAWSVIFPSAKLKWDYYKSNNSYNFGFIF
jgi:hypothetical protein